MDDNRFELERQKIIVEQMKALASQGHLAMQDLDKLNLEEVNPLTPEIISRQAT